MGVEDQPGDIDCGRDIADLKFRVRSSGASDSLWWGVFFCVMVERKGGGVGRGKWLLRMARGESGGGKSSSNNFYLSRRLLLVPADYEDPYP